MKWADRASWPWPVLATIAALMVSQTAAAAPVDLTGVWLRPPQKGDNARPDRINSPIPKPPLQPQAAAEYAATRAKRQAAEAAGTPIATEKAVCLPDGMPAVLGTTLPLQIVQTPDEILMVFEVNTQVRHIYLNATSHPADEDLEFTFFGDSIGRWEADTLVVDTVGVRKPTLLFEGAPHGDRLRISERYRLREPDLLEVTVTLTDPDVLDGPWTVTRLFAKQSGMRLREYICLENQRTYADDKGQLGTILKSN
ncbi:hypothetical protein [Caulobacter sp. RHG1]|uniref:hypothetical protein n=1 Tax=Caulobacter sp. (strain RHG1) TaxID=2545762 RepID=UPI00155344B9|nr:hypothetical protein [Caulobacter sp. RHG1]NQE61479.1 hypothetical protein [Caulobacter sp. RHG1]